MIICIVQQSDHLRNVIFHSLSHKVLKDKILQYNIQMKTQKFKYLVIYRDRNNEYKKQLFFKYKYALGFKKHLHDNNAMIKRVPR